ncbi:MAG: phosphoethanolamine transferase [Muribaculaceae bacterium]
MDYSNQHGNVFSTICLWLFVFTKTVVIVGIVQIVSYKCDDNEDSVIWKCVKVLAYLAIVLYVFLCIVNIVCHCLYGFGISHRLIVTLLETTVNEIAGFWPSFRSNLINTMNLWYTFGCFVVIYYGKLWLDSLNRKGIFTPVILVFALAGVPAMTYLVFAKKGDNYIFGRTNLFITSRVASYSIGAYKLIEQVEYLQSCVPPLPYADELQRDPGCKNIIVAIGESALRDQWQLYGYPMHTMPRISAMSDSLIVFGNAVGSSLGTADNLKHILTFKPDDPTTTEWFHFPNIIDLYNSAGYITSWFSNQEIGGKFANFSYAIASHSRNVKYIGNLTSDEKGSYKYDESLLPLIDEIKLNDTVPDLAFFHLIGSHTSYNERFPENCAHFQSEDILKAFPGAKHLDIYSAKLVADYNNSLAYTDSVLSRMINRLSKVVQPVIFFYFSDHGVSVNVTRVYDGRERFCARIPMIVYANHAFHTEYPEIVEQLKLAKDKPVSTANIIHTLINISGISYPLYDASRDFLSPQFQGTVRYVDETQWEEDVQAGLRDRYVND